MTDTSLASFERPALHITISEILRRHSTNPTDVRDAVLAGLDLAHVRRALDLGCGFGFMAEALAPRLPADAEIVGVDACADNREPFLQRVAAARRSGCFVARRIERRLDWPDRHFELVVASYALYFFPGVLPEIARVLTPGGLCLLVTHTASSCRDLLRAAGLPADDDRLLGNIQSFSAEEGERRLRPYFAEVERVDYPNTLAFEAAEFDDFLHYLRFKLPLILPDSEAADGLPKPLSSTIRAALTGQHRIVMEKNDVAFRCRGPRCP